MSILGDAATYFNQLHSCHFRFTNAGHFLKKANSNCQKNMFLHGYAIGYLQRPSWWFCLSLSRSSWDQLMAWNRLLWDFYRRPTQNKRLTEEIAYGSLAIELHAHTKSSGELFFKPKRCFLLCFWGTRDTSLFLCSQKQMDSWQTWPNFWQFFSFKIHEFTASDNGKCFVGKDLHVKIVFCIEDPI